MYSVFAKNCQLKKVDLTLLLIKFYAMEAWLHTFLTFALDGDKWSILYSCYSILVARTNGSCWIGDGVETRASLVVIERRKISTSARD
jgi:hypothetical protein